MATFGRKKGAISSRSDKKAGRLLKAVEKQWKNHHFRDFSKEITGDL